ncbi:unnamed protein product [Dimorphilus gyrociliatus]|uniref:Uncharacterized protein n=1 Tax=Dimorphilus gyrociliatus TaxID=2664684 RepID=A0A7I8VEV4_9ANNE|nr:unnamed protein product [Dimorphilus gyrociliatus]
MNCAGDAASICEQIDKYVFKEQIDHRGSWKFYDETGLYESEDSQEVNTRSDIYLHKGDITRRIFFSRYNKLTHLVRDPRKNLLFTVNRQSGSILKLNLNDVKDGEKDTTHFPILTRIENAWHLSIYSNTDKRVVVCLSSIRFPPQTISYIEDDKILWKEEFHERILQTCVLNTFDIIAIKESSIIKLSGKNGRRMKMIRSGFEDFHSACGVCSVPNGGFLVSDEHNRRIYSFSNDLQMIKILHLDFKPTDIYISRQGELFIARGRRKPYVSMIYHLSQIR